MILLFLVLVVPIHVGLPAKNFTGYHSSPEYVSSKDSEAIELRGISSLGNHLGRIISIVSLDSRYIIVGEDYVALNGSNNVFWLDGEALDITTGDIDMDGTEEIFIITSQKIYGFTADLETIFETNNTRGDDRIYVGNITSTKYSMIITWKHGTANITYYNHTGECVGNATLGTDLRIIQIAHESEWIWGLDNDTRALYVWKYGYSSAVDRGLGVCSHMVAVDNRVYTIASDALDTYLYELHGGGIYGEWDVSDSSWARYIMTSRELLVFDVDSDGYWEFLMHNGSLLCLLDPDWDGSTVVYRNVSQVVDYVSMIPNYAVVVNSHNLRFYSVGLDYTYECSLPIVPRLYGVGVVYAYDPWGGCYRIMSPSSIEPSFLDAGYRIIVEDGHITIHNRYRIIDMYPRNNITITLEYPRIYGVYPFHHRGFLVCFTNGTSRIYWDGWGWSMEVNLTGCVEADYDEDNDYLWVLMENGTIARISWITERYDALGAFRIYAAGGEIYYGLVKNTARNAALEIYRGSQRICVENISIVGLNNRIIGIRPYMVANDIDWDGDLEIGYMLYVADEEGNNTYGMGLIDNDTVVWSDRGSRINTTLWGLGYGYGVFPSPQGFTYLIHAEKFIRVLYDRTETEVVLGDGTWGGMGILASRNRIILETERGDIAINITGTTRCVGEYGVWTHALCLLQNRTIIRVWGALDIEEPTGKIEVEEYITTSRVSVNFTTHDDLGIRDVFLRLDYGEWINVTGEETYTISGLSEGPHIIWLNITDIANRTTTINKTFYVNIPISLQVHCPANNTYTNNTNIEISWRTHGPVDNITIYVNGTQEYVEHENLNGTHTLELDEGFWIIDVVARGYMERREGRIFLHIDQTPPTIGIEPENNTVVELSSGEKEASITIKISAKDNMGVEKIVVGYGNITWKFTGNEILLNVCLTAGKHMFSIVAIDRAGNRRDIYYVLIVNRQGDNGGSGNGIITIVIVILCGIIGFVVGRKNLLGRLRLRFRRRR